MFGPGKLFLPHFLTVLFIVIINQTTALAQSGVSKVEVGGQFTVLRLTELQSADPGVGGRIVFNLSSHVAVEGELNFLPRDLTSFLDRDVLASTNRTQGLFGVKVGWRGERFGVFGKTRPGFIHFNREEFPDFCAVIDPPPLACTIGGTTSFAFDLGGVFEFYPSRRTILRVDAGDTMIRYERFNRNFSLEQFVSHNAQVTVGVGYRF
jgi:hypothetical protein